MVHIHFKSVTQRELLNSLTNLRVGDGLHISIGCGVSEVFSAIFKIAVLRIGGGLGVVAIIAISSPPFLGDALLTFSSSSSFSFLLLEVGMVAGLEPRFLLLLPSPACWNHVLMLWFLRQDFNLQFGDDLLGRFS